MRLLTYSLLLLVLAASIGLSWIFDTVFARYAEPELSETYRDQIIIARHLAEVLDQQSTPGQWVDNWRSTQTHRQESYSLALTPQTDFPLPAELQKDFIAGEALLLESKNDISIHYYLPSHTGVLTLTLPGRTDTVDNPGLRLLLTFLFYGSLLTLLALWIYPLVRRLLKLRETAKAFGEGELQKRIEVGSVSFIGDIEKEFNAMARRIETLVSDIRLLSGSVSHDLRTPLARIRFGVETLAEEEDPQLRAHYQERVIQDVDDMVELVEKMLEFSRLEQNLLGIDKINVDFARDIDEHCRKKNTRALQWQIDDEAKSIRIEGDRTYLNVMVNNLLENALQYGKHRALLTLTKDQQQILLTVEDDGPGIAEHEIDKVTQPFVRGKNRKNTKGYGMGLAMVKRIAEWHGGQLALSRSETLGGASIQVALPAKEDAQQNLSRQ